jgi:hypothetical protein
MEDIQYDYFKLNKIPFEEFQKSIEYDKLIKNVTDDFSNLPQLTIVLMLFAWYKEEILGEQLKEVEKDKILRGEIKGCEIYDKEEYEIKYAKIIKEAEDREIKQLKDKEIEMIEENENENEILN